MSSVVDVVLVRLITTPTVPDLTFDISSLYLTRVPAFALEVIGLAVVVAGEVAGVVNGAGVATVEVVGKRVRRLVRFEVILIGVDPKIILLKDISAQLLLL